MALMFSLFFASGLVLSAQVATPPPLPTLASLLGETTSIELASGSKATRTDTHGNLDLLPNCPEAESLRSGVAADGSSILVETVFALVRKGPVDTQATEEELARIYGLMRSFSSLQGIEYYSASRHTMRTFYAESWLVSDADTRTRMPDPPAPRAGFLPRTESLLVWQKDLTFAGNIYEYRFSSFPHAVQAVSTNLTRMSYGIIPLIAPKSLVSRLLILQAADAIVFYVESDAKAPGIFAARIGESFSNRAGALFEWFSKNLPNYR